MDKELLEAISQMMDEKLKPIQNDIRSLKDDVNGLKDDVQSIKEAQEETRSGVNALLEWAEECGNVIKFPLPKVK